MFCYECGKEIEDNMAFCPYCGISLENKGNSYEEDEVTLLEDSEKADSENVDKLAKEYYWKGINIAVSEKKRASIYLEKAAEMGSSGAICALADNLAFGAYTFNDYRDIDYIPTKEAIFEAAKTYGLAYDKGSFLAKARLLKICLNSALGCYPENVFGYKKAEVMKLAIDWVENAKSNEERKYALKFMCDNFYGIIATKQILQYIEELISLDEKENYRLGILYLEGYEGLLDSDSIEPNLHLAEKYMLLARDADSVEASIKLYEIRSELDKLELYDIKKIQASAKLYMNYSSICGRHLAEAVAVWGRACVLNQQKELGFSDYDTQLEEGIECLVFYIKHISSAPNKTYDEEKQLIECLNLMILSLDIVKADCEKKEYIDLLNSNIKNFSLVTRAEYIETFWQGEVAQKGDGFIQQNRNYVKNILLQATNLEGFSYDDKELIRLCILEFYAYHKYEIDDEEISIINKIFDGNVEKELAKYKGKLIKAVREKRDESEACKEFLKKTKDVEEQVRTVNGIRYNTKADAEVAEIEIQQIQEIYANKKETDVQKYLCLIQQTFKTKSAQKAIDEKTEKLIKHIEYIKKNCTVQEQQVGISDLAPGLFWCVLGLIVFIKSGGLIGKGIAIFCLACGVNSIKDTFKENKTKQENAVRYAAACTKELAEFNEIFKIIDNKIVLKSDEMK